MIVFSPDGVVKKSFWPAAGSLTAGADGAAPAPLPESLAAFEPFRDRILTLKGVHNRVRGDGDGLTTGRRAADRDLHVVREGQHHSLIQFLHLHLHGLPAH